MAAGFPAAPALPETRRDPPARILHLHPPPRRKDVLLKSTVIRLLAALCLAACSGSRPPSGPAGEATSAPSPMPGGQALEPGEKMLFSEVDEFVGLGREALRDSLWFQAAENFDSALLRLTALEADDSLSPGLAAHIAAYRDSVQKLMVGAVSMTALAEPAPWTEQFDEEMKDVSDSTVHVMDSITHQIDPRDYDLPLTSPMNERTLQAVAVFMGPGKGYFSKWLARKSRYEALIIPRLEARGMPKDLIYLAMVESGFNPKAWSKAAAAGMWQFISGTGRRYGLKDDWWYDPRRDPVLATEAALDYLQDLYAEFGDWHQAMAAYNCGEGRVRRFRNANPAMSYWDMPLPQETRFYVPKILAAMIIGHNPERYGFKIENPEPPLAFDTATVTHCLSIATIARAAEVGEDDIIGLNPALRRWCTPPNRSSHVVYLPAGKREIFAANYEKLDKTNLVNWHHHVVGRGETLGGIASRYRVSLAAIKATNKMKGSKLRPGQSLLIPLAPEDARRYAERDYEEPRVGSTKYKGGTYKVRPGDNLFDIARKAGTTVSQLMAANKLKPGSVIRPGQRLKLSGKGSASAREDERDWRKEPPSPRAAASAPSRGEDAGSSDLDPGETRVHVVASGESIYSISRLLGVSQDDLMRWNGLESAAIQAGRRLKYRALDAEPGAVAEARAEAREAREARTEPVRAGPAKVSTPMPGGSRRWHRVQPGENLYQIARQHGVDHQSLMALNGLGEEDRIFPGDSLVVSGSLATKAPQDKPARGAGDPMYYVVKSGDSLWDISVQFRTTVQKLKALNGRLGANLQPGTRIRVR